MITMITSPMGNPNPMVGARVDPDIRDWIEQEAERRDRKKAYIVRELLEEGIERREGDGEEPEAVPA